MLRILLTTAQQNFVNEIKLFQYRNAHDPEFQVKAKNFTLISLMFRLFVWIHYKNQRKAASYIAMTLTKNLFSLTKWIQNFTNATLEFDILFLRSLLLLLRILSLDRLENE